MIRETASTLRQLQDSGILNSEMLLFEVLEKLKELEDKKGPTYNHIKCPICGVPWDPYEEDGISHQGHPNLIECNQYRPKLTLQNGKTNNPVLYDLL